MQLTTFRVKSKLNQSRDRSAAENSYYKIQQQRTFGGGGDIHSLSVPWSLFPNARKPKSLTMCVTCAGVLCVLP